MNSKSEFDYISDRVLQRRTLTLAIGGSDEAEGTFFLIILCFENLTISIYFSVQFRRKMEMGGWYTHAHTFITLA